MFNESTAKAGLSSPALLAESSSMRGPVSIIDTGPFLLSDLLEEDLFQVRKLAITADHW